MRNGRKSFVYALCGFIIISSWCICFLPTLFYMNPLEMTGSDKHANVNISFHLTPSFPCNPPLIFSNHSQYCKPPCDWLSFGEQEQRGMAIADWTTVVFCATCFCLALVTWFKLPEFMKFPHFIILLMAGQSAFIEILVIIPMLGKKSRFFCTSRFLDEATENATIFCNIQGALIHFVSLVIGELFVIYNAFLLKHLVIDKRPNEGYNKKFLTILFLSVILLPTIPVAYVLKSGEKYTPLYLRYCFPKNADEGYYSCLLPQQLFLSVGITCLLLVTFKLIKERKSTLIASPSQAKRRQLRLQKIAFQFIMVIIAYIACVYLSYGLLCVQLNNRKAYTTSLKKYFKCLIFTNNCAQDFLEYETSYGLIILSLLAGNVFQGATLILLVGKQKARHLWRSWWYCATRKCRTMKEMPKSTSSVQELQPSTCEEKIKSEKSDK